MSANLNTTTAKQLIEIHGISKKIANKLVKNQPYTSFNDIQVNVAGIDLATIYKLKKNYYINAPNLIKDTTTNKIQQKTEIKINNFNSTKYLSICHNLSIIVNEFQNKYIDSYLSEYTYNIENCLKDGYCYNSRICEIIPEIYSEEDYIYMNSQINNINRLYFNNTYKNKLHNIINISRPIIIKYLIYVLRPNILVSICINNDKKEYFDYMDYLLKNKYDVYETKLYFLLLDTFQKKLVKKSDLIILLIKNNSHRVNIELTKNQILNKKIISIFNVLISQ
jgi:hypothetical protein